MCPRNQSRGPEFESHSFLELVTNFRENFTITEKAPILLLVESTSTQQGEQVRAGAVSVIVKSSRKFVASSTLFPVMLSFRGRHR